MPQIRNLYMRDGHPPTTLTVAGVSNWETPRSMSI